MTDYLLSLVESSYLHRWRIDASLEIDRRKMTEKDRVGRLEKGTGGVVESETEEYKEM